MTAWLLALCAHAQTVAVTVRTDPGAWHDAEPGHAVLFPAVELPPTETPLHQLDEATRSIVWHALQEPHGHDPLLLPPDLGAAAETMARHHLTVLQAVDVSWHPTIRQLDGERVAAPVPQVSVTTWTLRDGALEPGRTWSTVAAPTLRRDAGGWVVLPERALQEAVEQALAQVGPPIWRSSPDTIPLPVEIVADTSFRARHGEAWPQVIDRRVGRASALLAQAGLHLEVQRSGEWQRDDATADLPALLADLADDRAPSDALPLRIGLTAQAYSDEPQADRLVGLAYTPGRALVAVDRSAPSAAPDVAVDPDDADRALAHEAVTLAHEILHALGVPHTPEPGRVMSSTDRATAHALGPEARALARAAVEARYGGRDALAALDLLCDAASEWLDPALRPRFVLENLALGPGVPLTAGAARISALTHRPSAGGEAVLLDEDGVASPVSAEPWGALPR